MLRENCTEALSIQANVAISGSSAKLIKNGIAPLPFPLPALLKQYWYIKRGERVRVRGHAPFYATLGLTSEIQKSLVVKQEFLRVNQGPDDVLVSLAFAAHRFLLLLVR